ncbi:MAG: phytoene desaturase family protein [Gemmatimonadota bacterium]
MSTPALDAVVVGTGPNGLAAAIALAEAGWSVRIFEANDEVGGAARTAESTRPGFLHDLGSTTHPLAAASPFFGRLPLSDHGLHWVHPDLPLAHPLDGGGAVLLHRSLDETAAELGEIGDGGAWRELFEPFVGDWPKLERDVLGPLLRWPHHPIALARFGLSALRSAEGLARSRFVGAPARALFAGLAAHSLLSLDRAASASFGLVLGVLAHRVGWPCPRGGAGRISEALAAHFRSLGGEIVTGRRIASLAELPDARHVVLGVTPAQALALAGEHMPARRRASLERWRYGAAAFKLDWALDAPIPWSNPDCGRAGTVHLGGTLDEIAAGEKSVEAGAVPERPFVLLAQHSLFDPTRAPRGGHTAWAYCHVPNGSSVDMTDRIEAQIERFAPGFSDRVLDRTVSAPADLERMNANLVGGSINGGVQDLPQMLARPRLSPAPYRLARAGGDRPGLYLCSSSTPPGGGVHGMCGWHAARTLLRDEGGRG